MATVRLGLTVVFDVWHRHAGRDQRRRLVAVHSGDCDITGRTMATGQRTVMHVQRGAESVRVVVFSRIKVVRGGFHLVLKDAIGGSARCIADGEHALTANIDPDGIRLAAVSGTGRLVRRLERRLCLLLTVAASSNPRAPRPAEQPAAVRGMAAVGTSQQRLGLDPDRSARRAAPSGGYGRRRSCACQPRGAPGGNAPLRRSLTVVLICLPSWRRQVPRLRLPWLTVCSWSAIGC